MATRAIATASGVGPGLMKATWTGLLNTDDGAAWTENHSPASFTDKTVQAFGTFGAGGSVAIQGSMDGTNWGALNDVTGTAIALTDLIPAAILENPLYIRPLVTAGDGTTDLTIIIAGRTLWV